MGFTAAQMLPIQGPPVVSPWASIDPNQAMDIAERTQRMAERGIYSTLFVVSLVVIGALCLWIVKLHFDFKAVSNARVDDQKEGKRELALALDKHTEALTLMLRDAQARAERALAAEREPKS